jgi:hypothetical protein
VHDNGQLQAKDDRVDRTVEARIPDVAQGHCRALARMRERLPLLRRQLAEAEAELGQLA